MWSFAGQRGLCSNDCGLASMPAGTPLHRVVVDDDGQRVLSRRVDSGESTLLELICAVTVGQVVAIWLPAPRLGLADR